MEQVSVVAEPGRSSDDLITVLDHIPAIVACWDAELHNLFANRTFADWFGTTPERMRGVHLKEVIGPAAFARRETEIHAALAGTPQRFNRVLVDHSGQERHLQLEFTPRIVGGQPHGMFALGTDITAHVGASEAIRAAGEALAVQQDREHIAGQVNALVTRQLYTAVLELSASLQPGLLDPEDRVHYAIAKIETAIKDLRVLLLRPDGSASVMAITAGSAPRDGQNHD